jgi:uncharacterized protein YqgV (UPF0045/DUF77 family)
VRVTAELSLYPLQDGYLPRIETLIRVLRAAPRVETAVNQMSTQLRGELADVMAALEAALADAFADGAPQALVVKLLNADLPIRERPGIDAIG